MAVDSYDLSQFSGGDDRAIPLVRPAVAAFVGRTVAGPVNEPVAVASVGEFQRLFGGHCAYSFMSHAVQQFFQHGGQHAVIVRVANRATRGRIDIPAGAQVFRLQAVEPGSQACLRASVDHDGVETQRDRFNLVVQRIAGPDSEYVQDQEIFRAVSTNPADPRFVGELLSESHLVRMDGAVPGVRPAATRARHPGAALPYIPMTVTGTDGDALTDYDIIGSNAEGTGLFALERARRIDLVCIPPAPGCEPGPTCFVAAERYCRRRGAMLIWDPPESWRSVDDAVRARRGTMQASRHALTYFPRIRRRGDVHRYPGGIPACGVFAAALAVADNLGVWCRDVAVSLRASLTPLLDIDAPAAAALDRSGVNVLQSIGNGSAVIAPGVTMSGVAGAPSERDLWRHRTLLFVLNSIVTAAEYSLLQRRAADAERRVVHQTGVFLEALRERGLFAGTTPAQSWFVRRAESARADLFGMRFGVALAEPGRFASYELVSGADGLCCKGVPTLELGESA